jgi:hypothetical protein
MAGPMANLASGNKDWTASAMTCAAEWRMVSSSFCLFSSFIFFSISLSFIFCYHVIGIGGVIASHLAPYQDRKRNGGQAMMFTHHCPELLIFYIHVYTQLSSFACFIITTFSYERNFWRE